MEHKQGRVRTDHDLRDAAHGAREQVLCRLQRAALLRLGLESLHRGWRRRTGRGNGGARRRRRRARSTGVRSRPASLRGRVDRQWQSAGVCEGGGALWEDVELGNLFDIIQLVKAATGSDEPPPMSCSPPVGRTKRA